MFSLNVEDENKEKNDDIYIKYKYNKKGTNSVLFS